MRKVFPLHILVTDINHHVRNLLQRELTKAGHIIYTAGNRKEAYEAVSGGKPLDLIILDPELFEIFGELFFMEFRDRMPKVPIILHTFSEFLTENQFFPDIKTNEQILFVEKNEQSIHNIKKIIQESI